MRLETKIEQLADLVLMGSSSNSAVAATGMVFLRRAGADQVQNGSRLSSLCASFRPSTRAVTAGTALQLHCSLRRWAMATD